MRPEKHSSEGQGRSGKGKEKLWAFELEADVICFPFHAVLTKKEVAVMTAQ